MDTSVTQLVRYVANLSQKTLMSELPVTQALSSCRHIYNAAKPAREPHTRCVAHFTVEVHQSVQPRSEPDDFPPDWLRMEQAALSDFQTNCI